MTEASLVQCLSSLAGDPDAAVPLLEPLVTSFITESELYTPDMHHLTYTDRILA